MKLFVFAFLIVAAAAMPAEPELRNYKSDNTALPEKWAFEYDIKDIPEPEEHKRQEEGEAKQIGDEVGATYRGSYSFVAPDGVTYTVNYVADENGFKATGDHIPAK